ncbi:MAG: hypothetical protein HOE69_04565, partial [Euryarchaeota archaeon]|nr:hypothetical protein [Euryarchaeota archaeon]
VQFQMLLHHRSEGLAGNNPFWAFENSKLHPYIFLYNLLWLPTNIERWVPADNDDYIRRFQIPLEVIENHYMDPQKTVQSLKSINREQSFKTGGISLPEDDIRDFENCKKDGNYRNITNLLGIMALRHNHALGYPAEGPIHINEKEILTAVQHKELVGRHGRKGDVLSKECLDPESVKDGGDIESEVEDPWAKDGNTPPSPENNGDTIENRRDAWFKAYINWYDYAKGKDDADSGNLDLSELRE